MGTATSTTAPTAPLTVIRPAAADTGAAALLPRPRVRGTAPTPSVDATPEVPPAVGDPAGGHIPQLTGLRFVAAVWVLLLHASYVPGEVFARWLEPVAPLVSAGSLGVDLFFVLSGLVLTRSYLDRMGGRFSVRSTGSFLRARVRRIWPLYLVVTALFGLWCSARWVFGGDDEVVWQAAQPDLGPLSWLRQLTMTQLWDSPTIHGVSFVLPAWSVSAEWLAYLTFPVLVLLAARIRTWPTPVLAVLAVAAATPMAVAALVTGAGEAVPFSWALRIGGGFTAGVLTWLVVARIPRTPRTARWAQRALLIVVAETVLVAYWAASAPASAALSADARVFLAVPLFPVLLGALCLARGRAVAWLGHERLQHGGRISYALYLVHFPLIEITVVAMTRFPALAPNSSLAALVVPHVLVASVVVAHYAHRWVELRWATAGRSAAGCGAART